MSAENRGHRPCFPRRGRHRDICRAASGRAGAQEVWPTRPSHQHCEATRFLDGGGHRQAIDVGNGDYDKDNVVNAGAGRFWTWRPGFVYGRAWDNGPEFGTRVTYSFNGVDSATHVRSGQYAHADHSLMYRCNDLWRFGLQGYAVKQFTKDTGPGVAADGNKAQTYALGPSVGYQSEDGEFAAELKVLPEFHARNRPEGTTSWLRLAFRLD